MNKRPPSFIDDYLPLTVGIVLLALLMLGGCSRDAAGSAVHTCNQLGHNKVEIEWHKGRNGYYQFTFECVESADEQ